MSALKISARKLSRMISEAIDGSAPGTVVQPSMIMTLYNSIGEMHAQLRTIKRASNVASNVAAMHFVEQTSSALQRTQRMVEELQDALAIAL